SSRRPPAYPEVTSTTPRTRSNTASTPQKQPPASTATAVCPFVPGAASTVGGGTSAADSAHPLSASAIAHLPAIHIIELFIPFLLPVYMPIMSNAPLRVLHPAGVYSFQPDPARNLPHHAGPSDCRAARRGPGRPAAQGRRPVSPRRPGRSGHAGPEH